MDEMGRVHYMERVNGTSYSEITKSFIGAIKRYRIAGGYCEVNGPGRPVYEVFNQNERKIQEFVTTNDSKTEGIRALIYDIQEQKLELPSKELFSHLYNELNAYSYKINATGTVSFNAPSGLHDDCIMSLMLANQARRKLAFSKSKLYIGNRNKQQIYQ
jgi:hypothetical protein